MGTAEATLRRGIFARPRHPTGAWGWLTTVDHKKIGVLYGSTALLFFLIGGIEAMLIRLQLAKPDGTVLSANAYNQIFTMHGITMIFFVVMPLGAAFFNYMIPLMIGARDVAFPRLNAFSYWVFLFAGLFVYSSFLLGGAPHGGWFGYTPLNTQYYEANTPGVALNFGHNSDFFLLALIVAGISSTVAAVNFLVTIINLRAPGMSLMRMPLFIWMAFVVQFLLVFALPVLTVGLFQALFDRLLCTNFYRVGLSACAGGGTAAGGGDPVLWQHMFWLFGHPEVYILILPAMGIVSEVLPTFSRKPLFGYPVVVFSGIAIGLMSWGVWAHHMFAVGLGPVANSAFALSTMFIAVPTGVKIFNWLATVWRGHVRLTTPFLFSVGFVALFIIGGLSGVTHALVPSDYQQTDTYYIVAHFHYVLFGGAIFGLFSGVYYWWPKIFGRMLNEKLGKLHFWLMFIGANLTFGPMHIVGLEGQPRRTYTYPKGMGWDTYNFMETIGGFIIALSILVFIINAVRSRRGAPAGNDPWDGRTLEWSISSPPPEHNFDEIPVVHSLDDFWHRKYVEDKSGKLVRVPSGAQENTPGDGERSDEEEKKLLEHQQAVHKADVHAESAIHMPSPSYMPLIAALGLPIMAYGVVYRWWGMLLGGALVAITGFYGWVFEPGTE